MGRLTTYVLLGALLGGTGHLLIGMIRGWQGYLAGRMVTIGRSLVDNTPPWIEQEGRRFALHDLDPVKNGQRRKHKPPKAKPGIDVPFDPPKALLDALLRRKKGDDQ